MDGLSADAAARTWTRVTTRGDGVTTSVAAGAAMTTTPTVISPRIKKRRIALWRRNNVRTEAYRPSLDSNGGVFVKRRPVLVNGGDSLARSGKTKGPALPALLSFCWELQTTPGASRHRVAPPGRDPI